MVTLIDAETPEQKMARALAKLEIPDTDEPIHVLGLRAGNDLGITPMVAVGPIEDGVCLWLGKLPLVISFERFQAICALAFSARAAAQRVAEESKIVTEGA